MGDLVAALRPPFGEPAVDVVDRAHEEEDGELGIAGLDRAVVDALLHQLPQARVHDTAPALNLLAVFLRHRVVLGENHAGAEFARHLADVARHEQPQRFQRIGGVRTRLLQRLLRHADRQAVALVQDFVLVLDVAVQRRLGHAQGLGHVVERGVVKALDPESAARCRDQGVLAQIARVGGLSQGVVPTRGRGLRGGAGGGHGVKEATARGASHG